MRDLEVKLISKIMLDGSPRKAKSLGVGLEYFTNPKCALAWKRLLEYGSMPGQMGEVPTKRQLTKHTGLELLDYVDESMMDLVKELRDDYSTRTLRKCVIEVDDLLRAYGPELALEHLNSIAKELNSGLIPDSNRLDLADAIPRFKESYELMQKGNGINGIPFPWAPMNDGTGGMAPGTFNVIYGPSKSGKTWMGLEVGVVHPFERANARTLVVSNEMPNEQIYRRVLARMCRLDYGQVVRAALDEDGRAQMYEHLNSIHQEQIDELKQGLNHQRYRAIRCVKPSSALGGGCNAIRSEIEAFQPDLVFIDGVYLMTDDRTKTRDMSWRTIANITQDLKMLATRYNLPIIGTTQSNREGVKRKPGEDMDSYDDVGFGLGAIQDADMVMRVQKIETNQGEKVLVTLPAMRESKVDSFTVNFVPVVDFGLHQINLTRDQVKTLMNLADNGSVAQVSNNIQPEQKEYRRRRQPQPVQATPSLPTLPGNTDGEI